MNSTVRAIIESVATEFTVPVERITEKCRSPRVVRARIEAVRRIKASGKYSTHQIAAMLNHDHTTILFYLGRLSCKSPNARLTWRRPKIRHLGHRGCKHCYVPVKPRQKPVKKVKRRLYLIPYAGADFSQYRFKERPCHG
ncbi:helix-turn-helix domain-containing protein [Bradyrhizobium sp. Leo121]|uniref:helix-turn-helix domain-containing protein n=1 Tax=Bradyrhizobium sp. Leo121 TaxID=1571195 RepID=UPI001029F9C9|nr:helix-turn-helix domain-containing protein [Bradyrhizobium sp. Leo121]RZN30469.1 hypothetical protein CWO90_20240 [Bradyrhizobium sp. Leo121]